jgi:hypothetical protein
VKGEVRLNLHDGQRRVWESERRILLMLAGTQSGKTSFGPHWLYREIQRCGQGDYLVVAPTFPLLDLKAIPAFCWLFETRLQLGRLTTSPSHKFTFSEEGERRLFGSSYDPNKDSTRVIFGYATEPESLESATAKAAWLDEAGQKRFKVGSYEAIRRRLSLARGRMLVTTSLYASNWVRTLYDRWAAGDESIGVVQFDSTTNPQFSRAEFDEARRSLPRWKFKMQYEGQFEKPAGLIYDCIDPNDHFVPRFAIPPSWPRYLGQDFGSANMAAVLLAQEPETKRLFVYREYHAGGLSVPGHVRQLMHGASGQPVGLPLLAVGGAPSEDDWRTEFRKAGLPTRKPRIADREVQIDKVYGAFQKRGLFVFDDLAELKEELTTYSRRLNDHDVPTEEIEDEADYHLHAALRYVVSDLGAGSRIMRSGYVAMGQPTPAPNIGALNYGHPRGTPRPGVRFAHGCDWEHPRPRTPLWSPARTDAEVEALLAAADLEQAQ